MTKLVLAISLLSLCVCARASPLEDRIKSQSENLDDDQDGDRRGPWTLVKQRSDGHLRVFDGHFRTTDELHLDPESSRRCSRASVSRPYSHVNQPGLPRGHSSRRSQFWQSDTLRANPSPSESEPRARITDTDADDTPAIWITLAQRGIDYLKDMLLTQVLETITPFSLPSISKRSRIPFVGDVSASCTNVTLVHAKVPSSTITFGDSGIAMHGSNVAANLTLNWQYVYDNLWLPEPVTDAGEADIKVKGMQAGLSMIVQEYVGTLNLSVLQCGTYIDELDVQLNGASSWLYQWLIEVLDEHIRTTFEEQLRGQIQEGVQYLNSILLDTPQQVQVNDMSELNFTIVSEPVVSPTSLSIGVKGKFSGRTATEPYYNNCVPRLPPGLVCNRSTKMVTIALSESVFKDGAALYYNADLLNWLMDKVPEEMFLNTSKWKHLIPELYLRYPNEAIKLRFEVSDPPEILLTLKGIDVAAAAHMNIGVVNNGTLVQVVRINIAVSAFGSAGLNENNITGQVTLKDLSLDLEWSNVGKIHLALVKVFARALIKDALLPYLNLSLRRGFPLPMLPGMKLKDSSVDYGMGFLLVCTDAEYVGNVRYLQ